MNMMTTAMQSGKTVPLSHCVGGTYFYPEDSGHRFHQNVSLPDYMALDQKTHILHK